MRTLVLLNIFTPLFPATYPHNYAPHSSQGWLLEIKIRLYDPLLKHSKCFPTLRIISKHLTMFQKVLDHLSLPISSTSPPSILSYSLVPAHKFPVCSWTQPIWSGHWAFALAPLSVWNSYGPALGLVLFVNSSVCSGDTALERSPQSHSWQWLSFPFALPFVPQPSPPITC